MSKVILDLGSGNSCRNSIDYAKRMIDVVADMDSHRHEVIFKFQLEEVSPPGQLKLDRGVFSVAYNHARKKGYACTSSVFDYPSLSYLLGFQVPFVKIACAKENRKLVAVTPRGMPILLSMDAREFPPDTTGVVGHPEILLCVPECPAKLLDYPPLGQWENNVGYSDHTPGLELWNYYHPLVYEKHFVLERSPDNPDSGVFALDPSQLQEVIG